MATPEEWAEQVVGVVILDGRSPEGWLKGIKQAIASYIEEAVEDERERCAKIAETWVDPEHAKYMPDATGCTAAFNEGLECTAVKGIAASIREGK
jgi:hypothetical protein